MEKNINKGSPRAVSEFVNDHIKKNFRQDKIRRFVPISINADEKGFFIEGYTRTIFNIKRPHRIRITNNKEMSFPNTLLQP